MERLNQWNYLAAKIFHSQNKEKTPSYDIGNVVLVQRNSVDDQYQQKSKVLYTFTLNKPYAYLLNVIATNLVFLKNYNTNFDEIVITCMDQNSRPLEI